MTKSSDAKSASRRDPLTYFIDRSLGRQIVASKLREAGFKVEIHDDHFLPDAKDEDWLAIVGQKGWVVLTKDKNIRYRNPELLAVVKGNAKVYTLMSGNITALQMAEVFEKAIPHIENSVDLNEPPYIAKILSTGSVKIWVGRKELIKQFRVK